jgi:hypothetical protein
VCESKDLDRHFLKEILTEILKMVTSPNIRKMQIKTAIRSHLTLSGWLRSKREKTNIRNGVVK